MYHFYFLVTFNSGDSYILRIKTNYVDRESARSRAKQVAAIQFYGRRDKYELSVLTLSGVLRQLCFDDNLVQFTKGVPMSVFFFQVVLPDDDRIYFVRVQTKFSERKQARAKAIAIAVNRFGRTDFKCRPISEDDLFGVIASGDSTGIEIITAGCEIPDTSQQVKMMGETIDKLAKTVTHQQETIESLEGTIANQKGTIEILESQLAGDPIDRSHES